MTTHSEPFRNMRHIPADLGVAAWNIIHAYADDAWVHARPRLAATLTRWGNRLA